MSGDAAYTIYDVLRTLIERVGWPSETEKRLCTESVNMAEQVHLFGNMAVIIACKHELPPTADSAAGRDYFRFGAIGPNQGNRCIHCGKIM